jgi:hypothetical protein
MDSALELTQYWPESPSRENAREQTSMANEKKPLKYDATVRPADTERAMTVITPRLVPTEARPHTVEFTGNCPRCDHPTESRTTLVTIAGALRMNADQRQKLMDRLDDLGVDLSTGDETFDLICDCSEHHGGHPENVRGCGARFRVRVTWP